MIKVNSIFSNLIATKKLDLSKLKFIGKNYKKTFESKVKTTLKSNTLLDVKSMNYLNIELTDLLSHLMKPYCKNFVFNLSGIWINEYNNNDYQGSHVHPSDFSFIIYYDVDKSSTVFNSPVKNILDSASNHIFPRIYEPNLKRGDIIMFPSYMEHWVKPNSDGKTVAGNIKIIDMKGKND